MSRINISRPVYHEVWGIPDISDESLDDRNKKYVDRILKSISHIIYDRHHNLIVSDIYKNYKGGWLNRLIDLRFTVDEFWRVTVYDPSTPDILEHNHRSHACWDYHNLDPVSYMNCIRMRSW